MKINVSEILKADGASIDIKLNENLEGLNAAAGDFTFSSPVSFEGSLTNIGGVLKLEGCLKASYSTGCYRCLNDIDGSMNIEVKEDFISGETNKDSDAYAFEGSLILIDKPLIDNVLLNLPMKLSCSEDCKGLCKVCGLNLNSNECNCKEENINPKFEVLKDFFKK